MQRGSPAFDSTSGSPRRIAGLPRPVELSNLRKVFGDTGAMETWEMLRLIENWNIWDTLDRSGMSPAGRVVRAMTEQNERELVAMLRPAADECPIEGPLSTRPEYRPLGGHTDTEVFLHPG